MRYLLPHIIDETAERFPDKEAFRFYDQSLTYAELAQQANRLANLLVEQGVKRGDCVGISTHKALRSAIAIFGVMKAGAAYVPLDPQMPLSRLVQIIGACNIRLLISHERKRSELRQISALETGLECVIGLPSGDDLLFQAFDWVELNQVSAVCPNVRLMEQDIAYIMYTSGSTGEPKGIIHTHHSGLSYAEMAAELYGALRPIDLRLFFRTTCWGHHHHHSRRIYQNAGQSITADRAGAVDGLVLRPVCADVAAAVGRVGEA
jgi:acyl-coenzyme A synthetase/AMP-(fatty) acid ligase